MTSNIWIDGAATPAGVGTMISDRGPGVALRLPPANGWHASSVKIRCAMLAAALAAMVGGAHAQTAPEIGYMYPSGGQSGTVREVTLGGYDWTPDMQLFVHDPRIKLELLGPPTSVLVPEPPYWFGAKARGPAWPLPREFKARLTIPPDVPPELVRWQVANANGASPVAVFHVGSVPEVLEDAGRKSPQALPGLPITVSGQIRKIEEVDQYEFSVAKSGPVTVELLARRLGSPLHGMLKIHDGQRKLVVDLADTEGRDLTVTFTAQAGMKYTLSLHDLDFAGDRSYVYRLTLTGGPQVLAAYPSAGRRGETRRVEFVGIGVATGSDRLEAVARDVAFAAAADANSLECRLETPWGAAARYTLLVTDIPEHVESAGLSGMLLPAAPCAVTGAIETHFGTDQYMIPLRKDGKWRIAAQARAPNCPLDLELSVLGPDGKEIVAQDDVPGTTDPSLLLTVPADGVYKIAVSDRSGKSGTRAACYRLSVEPQREGFVLTVPPHMSVPLGAQAKLAVNVVREGGFRGAIPLTLASLPTSVTGPQKLEIPADKNELAIDLTCAADAPASAALCTVTATAPLNGQPPARCAANLLLATVMKPRCKVTPEGLDDVRKVHRGSTFLAPLLIERLEGFQGEVMLEMTSKQQRHRQGLASDALAVLPGMTRVEYPIFVPEWMETTKTSRMILNGVVKVPDPRGNVRTLVNRMELRIGILPEGALMKLSHAAGEPTAQPGVEVRIPLTLSRAPEFREAVRVELVPSPEQAGLISAQPLTLTAQRSSAQLLVRLAGDARLHGEQSLQLRATAQQGGRWPVISATTVLLNVSPASK